MKQWLANLPSPWRVVGALFAGFMVFASYEPTGLWWAAPLGYALFFAVVTQRHAVSLAFLNSLATYGFLLPWIGEFVGASAWIALAIVQALYALLFGLGARWLLRWANGTWNWRSIVGAAAFFVAVEGFRSHWPFGGFGWGRLAWGQVSGPLAADIRLGGSAFVSFLVVLLGGFIYLAARPPYNTRAAVTPKIRLQYAGVVGVVLLASVIYGSSFSQEPTAGQVNVAAIQGNVPRAGLDFAAQRRAVLNNHVQRTHELADSVATGEAPQPDVVIWPENSSDVNPFKDPDAYTAIDSAVTAVNAPVMVGTVIGNENTMLTWGPATSSEPGPGEKHVKKFLQPFGEYMPFREILKHVNENVERAGNFVPGDGPGVVRMPAARGGVLVGVSTCYEISFDASARDAVRNGAEFLASPTNNATFGFTDMSYQQLAMSRMRAIETDRAVVVAATSGVSAIVMPDGEVVAQSRLFRPDLLQADIPLRDGITPSVAAGPWVELGLAAAGVLGIIGAFLASRPTRRKKSR